MRERNGWIDDGTPLRNTAKTCPNCGSLEYRETLSREHCRSCGLECDYWGSGTNAVYEAMIARDAQAERQQRDQEQRDWEADESNWRI